MGYTALTLPPDLALETRVNFMGLEFDAFDTKGTVQVLLEMADRTPPLTYLVTPNVDHMVRLDNEPDLRPLYDHAGLIVCDSRILELLARLDRKPLPASPGADVVEKLILDHIEPGEKIVLIGGDVNLVEALARDHGITNVAWHAPPMGLRHNPDAVKKAAEFVCRHNERFAFVCVGSPQQEMIAYEAAKMGTGKGVALCCGASLDFLTGKTTRAPKWMREARLEWLHRLTSEPRRLWKRYLVDGPRIFRIWMKSRQD
ncbi:MAG: glycosyltransferase [Ponticaulis sp.]|nr:glycosyltransferase [Ponticaulis sp.]|tara:strand:- start:20251 stop:21024 length:774 start_codon:yes stop_codon:yes gene_type:complete